MVILCLLAITFFLGRRPRRMRLAGVTMGRSSRTFRMFDSSCGKETTDRLHPNTTETNNEEDYKRDQEKNREAPSAYPRPGKRSIGAPQRSAWNSWEASPGHEINSEQVGTVEMFSVYLSYILPAITTLNLSSPCFSIFTYSMSETLCFSLP